MYTIEHIKSDIDFVVGYTLYSIQNTVYSMPIILQQSQYQIYLPSLQLLNKTIGVQ